MNVLRTTLAVAFLWPWLSWAQIDPFDRELLQIGYNGALQGHQPLAAYAFYYHNMPGFLRTNLTLRLAVAPTYLDSELGIEGALGRNTDVGIGLAGGGFADSYVEIRRGKYYQEESFYGHGGEISASIYHRFNPESRIPLTGVLRGTSHFSAFSEMDDTDEEFEVPDNLGIFRVRTGLRWGGRDPTLFPGLAMELSGWYDGAFRNEEEVYGYDDRRLKNTSHLFWGQATLVYTFSKLLHTIDLSLSAGTSLEADRFSAYRLGALLPLASEFPLSLPGYYFQEISAEQFVLLSGNYLMPLERSRRWNLNLMAATAVVDYLDGLEQPGNWHSGVGAGILYRTSSLKTMVGYAYGVDAIRSDGRGAHSIGLLLQLDWGRAKEDLFNTTTPNLWRGFQRIFGVFGN